MLDRVVGRAVDVAEEVRDRDARLARGVEREHECGASAVPEPWRATTGLAISNSETPPVVKVSGLAWFAFTSTGVVLPSAVIVCGSTAVRGRHPVAPVADDAGHARPVVGDGDQAGVGPVLRERQLLCRRVGGRWKRADEYEHEQRDEDDSPVARGAKACA